MIVDQCYGMFLLCGILKGSRGVGLNISDVYRFFTSSRYN